MNTHDQESNLQLEEQVLIEGEWVKSIKNGDHKAFENLFNFYCQRLINFVRRYIIDVQIAENIVQEVFVSVWNQRERLNPSKMIKSYLFTAVKNEALNELRHRDVQTRSQERILNLITKDTNPEQELTSAEIDKEIHQAINELPEKCREIFKMNRFDELKYAEIAEILNISIKTVETQMGRALKKLRERLKPFLPMIYFIFIVLIYFLSLS